MKVISIVKQGKNNNYEGGFDTFVAGLQCQENNLEVDLFSGDGGFELEDNIREMRSVIANKRICVHQGHSHIVMKKAYVEEYGEFGVNIYNVRLVDAVGEIDTIVNLNFRDITSLEKMEINKEIEYRGESLFGDFIIEVLS